MSGTDYALAPGTRFGQYEVVRILGKGGMGAVYEARHTTLKKRVALKVMHPIAATSDDMVVRFMREGEAAARIQHPHVVDVSDVGVHEGRPYLVMEYLEGEDLGMLIDREGALTVDRTVAIMLPVISALAAAHEAGVVHRDLKPDNIFLAKSRHGEIVPKVLDFGISKLVDASPNQQLTRTTAIMGTPFYMSPEQTTGSKHLDARTDQYSLGVILYECVTGRRPYDATTLYDLMQAIVEGTASPPSAMRPSIPSAFDRVILRAMHKAPVDRFATLGALARAMLPFANERTRAFWLEEFSRSTSFAAALVRHPDDERASQPTDAVTLAGTTVAPAVAAVLSRETRSSAISTDSEPAIRTETLLGGGTARRRVGVVAIAAGLACAVMAAALWHAPSAVAPRANTNANELFHVEMNVTPSEAIIELDGAPTARGTLIRDLARDGTPHQIRVFAPGFGQQTVAFRDAPPPPWIQLAPLPETTLAAPIAAPPVAPPPTVAALAPVTVHPAALAVRPATRTASRTVSPHPSTAPASATAAGTNGAPILN